MHAVSLCNLVLGSRHGVTTQETICCSTTAVRTSNLITRWLDVLPNRIRPTIFNLGALLHFMLRFCAWASFNISVLADEKNIKFPYYSAQTKTLLSGHRGQDTAHPAVKYAAFPRGVYCTWSVHLRLVLASQLCGSLSASQTGWQESLRHRFMSLKVATLQNSSAVALSYVITAIASCMFVQLSSNSFSTKTNLTYDWDRLSRSYLLHVARHVAKLTKS